MQSGERAASVYLDWIRPGIQLLYTAFTPKGSAGYQSVNGRSSPRGASGPGVFSPDVCGCRSNPAAPGWHDAVHARVGDGSAGLFFQVSDEAIKEPSESCDD